MRSRTDDIRHRIAKRRNGRSNSKSISKSFLSFPNDEEKYGFNQMVTYEGRGNVEEPHPLFKKEIFLFKILASVCLFLLVAILFRNHTGSLDSVRNMVKKTMDTEFQFATVSNWYENKFGKPLALLPFAEKKQTENTNSNQQYAVPASGRIVQNFVKNGQGVMIETDKGAQVKAMNGGLVTFAGIKDGLGKTVIIQHSDKTESWYGNLLDIQVNLYDYVNKGKVVGSVSTSGNEDKSKGSYYFAIKKGDKFIDPIQVIRFD
ncbi:MAG: M23 family metallopeptidase [Bacillota bacterium]|nr:M23 family metallopeptidase [Bacillota bacterium]